MTELKYITFKEINPEYRNNYAVSILVGYHNALTHLQGRCGYDCGRDCSTCQNHKDMNWIEDLMNDWAMDVENRHPELKGKLVKSYLSSVHVDIELKGILKKPREYGRCTGITDKNGTMIYENDYVKTKFGRICKVVWLSNDGNLCFDLVAVDNITEDNCPSKYDIWKPENLEVLTDYEPE